MLPWAIGLRLDRPRIVQLLSGATPRHDQLFRGGDRSQ
jgi:hypothetical protein